MLVTTNNYFSGFFALWSVMNLFSIIFKKENMFDVIFENIIEIDNCNMRAVCTITVSLCMAFVILFSNRYFAIKLGCDDIRVMPEGEYCYYVLATNEKGKTYTLPAKILKRYTEYQDENGTEIQSNYYVEEVRFKNGGYLYFDDTCELYYNKKTNVFGNKALDQNERYWHIEFTGRKTHNKNIKETEVFKEELILPFAAATVIIINMILDIAFNVKKRKRPEG